MIAVKNHIDLTAQIFNQSLFISFYYNRILFLSDISPKGTVHRFYIG